MTHNDPMPTDLFESTRHKIALAPGAYLLGGFARHAGEALLDELSLVSIDAPFRHLETPGGYRMSVAMTNCGSVGWVSDRQGYRYSPTDPLSERRWPEMPACFSDLARRAALAAGFADYRPDACLINRYEPGSRLTLHQDRDEAKIDAPIISISLGISATFLWGGPKRTDPVQRHPLHHGDVVVWGGPSRLNFHGIAPIVTDMHPLTGAFRYNLTFRHAM